MSFFKAKLCGCKPFLSSFVFKCFMRATRLCLLLRVLVSTILSTFFAQVLFSVESHNIVRNVPKIGEQVPSFKIDDIC